MHMHLQRGDYIIISKMTGYSIHTVSSQLRGVRTLSDKVRNAAIKIIKNREWLVGNEKPESQHKQCNHDFQNIKNN